MKDIALADRSTFANVRFALTDRWRKWGEALWWSGNRPTKISREQSLDNAATESGPRWWDDFRTSTLAPIKSKSGSAERAGDGIHRAIMPSACRSGAKT